MRERTSPPNLHRSFFLPKPSWWMMLSRQPMLATEIVLDPFLRHPMPPLARVRALNENLRSRGVSLRLRLPSIVRPEERRQLDKWLALDLPINTGHLGLVAELSAQGRDVVADYSVNCFNQHTAAEIFKMGARRITLSIELTRCSR
jgi:putative protease